MIVLHLSQTRTTSFGARPPSAPSSAEISRQSRAKMGKLVEATTPRSSILSQYVIQLAFFALM
jgi:hypothetical protein